MVGSICLSAFSHCAVVCASQAPRDAPGLLPDAGAFAFSPLLAALAEQRHALANLNSAMVRPCWSAQCRRGSFYRLCPSFSRFICSFVNHRRILGEVVDAAMVQRGMLFAFANRESTIRSGRFFEVLLDWGFR